MRKCFQNNKQTINVKIKMPCKRCVVKKPFRLAKNRKRCRYRNISALEEIYGVIFQKGDLKPHVYFRSIRTCCYATVTIQNDTTSKMHAIIKMKTKEITQTIEQSQQISLVLPFITSLAIVCGGESAPYGRGNFTIRFRRRL